MKTSDIIFILLVLATAAATYSIKYNSANQRARLADLNNQINEQKEAIDILHADWSLLTSPARLQRLVEQYQDELPLNQIQPHQVISVESIPLRPILNVEQRMAIERDKKLQENGISGLLTGSVRKNDNANIGENQ